MSAPKAETIAYVVNSLPLHWVIRHEGELFIVRAAASGWATRRPYKGHDPEKIPGSRVSLPIGCGIPIPEADKTTADRHKYCRGGGGNNFHCGCKYDT